MSLSKIQILLHTKDPSKRLHVLALDLKTYTFFKIKISNAEEIIKRNYKGYLKNAYMIFMIDCSEAFKISKSEKKFRQNSECFKDYSSLWRMSPKDVKNEYEKVFKNYMELKPSHLIVIAFRPQENSSESGGNSNNTSNFLQSASSSSVNAEAIQYPPSDDVDFSFIEEIPQSEATQHTSSSDVGFSFTEEATQHTSSSDVGFSFIEEATQHTSSSDVGFSFIEEPIQHTSSSDVGFSFTEEPTQHPFSNDVDFSFTEEDFLQSEAIQHAPSYNVEEMIRLYHSNWQSEVPSNIILVNFPSSTQQHNHLISNDSNPFRQS